MRLTPAAASSPTENDFPLIPTMKLTGFETAAQTARTAARSGQAGGEEHIGSSVFEGMKAADGVVQARGGKEEIVRSRSQDKGKPEKTRRLRSCRNPFDSQVKIIKGTVRVARRILNRAPNQSHLGGKPDRFRHDFRRVAKPLFQIRRDWQIRGIDNHARVGQRFIARQPTVFSTKGSGRGSARSPAQPSRARSRS